MLKLVVALLAVSFVCSIPLKDVTPAKVEDVKAEAKVEAKAETKAEAKVEKVEAEVKEVEKVEKAEAKVEKAETKVEAKVEKTETKVDEVKVEAAAGKVETKTEAKADKEEVKVEAKAESVKTETAAEKVESKTEEVVVSEKVQEKLADNGGNGQGNNDNGTPSGNSTASDNGTASDNSTTNGNSTTGNSDGNNKRHEGNHGNHTNHGNSTNNGNSTTSGGDGNNSTQASNSIAAKVDLSKAKLLGSLVQTFVGEKEFADLLRTGSEIIAQAERRAKEIESRLSEQNLLQSDGLLGLKEDGTIDANVAVDQITSLVGILTGTQVTPEEKNSVRDVVSTVTQVINPMLSTNSSEAAMPDFAALGKLFMTLGGSDAADLPIQQITSVMQMLLTQPGQGLQSLLDLPEEPADNAIGQLASAFLNAFDL